MKRTTIALLATATAIGLAIAWIDSRPGWDDTGITAGALLLTSAVLGAAGPKRPCLWALAVGTWIPLYGILHGGNATTLLVLAVTFAGAYFGAAVRRAISPPIEPTADRP